jgi:hypothetical protein
MRDGNGIWLSEARLDKGLADEWLASLASLYFFWLSVPPEYLAWQIVSAGVMRTVGAEEGSGML